MSTYSLRAVVGLCVVGALLGACTNQRTSAPVVDRSPTVLVPPKPPVAQQMPVPGAQVSSAPSGYYQVKRGDTLYSIALDHGTDPRDLVQWNRIENPGRLQVGQVLRVTPPDGQPAVQVGAARGAGAIDAKPLDSRPAEARPPVAAAGGVKTEPKALRLPYSSENLAMLQKSEAAPAPSAQPAPKPEQKAETAASQAAKPAAEPHEADGVEFIWPARGKVLTGFSEPANKGVDIGGKPGDPVVAAASGRVIYIGTGIRGYGKLIVIKHDNNFNSVYAHNREILVKQDQAVARGQKIAELGDTDSDSPKLHFEIRKSGKPVDPVKYLPPS